MPSPAILPWIARRNAIKLERAEELWDQAVGMADLHYGRGNVGSDYWKCAVQAFLRLASRDGAAMAARNPFAVPGAHSSAVQLLSAPYRFGQLTLTAIECMVRFGTDLWTPGVASSRPDPRSDRRVTHH